MVTIKSHREIELMREAGKHLAKTHAEMEKANEFCLVNDFPIALGKTKNRLTEVSLFLMVREAGLEGFSQNRS